MKTKRSLLPIKGWLLLAIGVAFQQSAIRAEISMENALGLQKKAPEALTLKVASVHRTTRETSMATIENVVVFAEVTGVIRSASKLATGSRIRIEYKREIRKRPQPGASPPPALKKGQSCPAFLKQSKVGAFYEPAAVRYSFAALDKPTAKKK